MILIQSDLQLVSRIKLFFSVIFDPNYPFKLIKIAVKLSELFLLIASFITSSTHFPLIRCIDSPACLIIVFQIIRLTSTDSSFSNIPSHPKNKKSSLSYIVNLVISGSKETQFGIPSKSGSLASMSPKVLVTDSFPGYTLNGPIINY